MPKELLAKLFDLLQVLLAKEVLSAELTDEARVSGRAAPARERIVKCQEIGILYKNS